MEIPSFSVEQLVGQQLGDYQVLELAAAHTSSAVYAACQQSTGRSALLTTFLIPADFSLEARSRFQERFLLLASALAQLDHAHILSLYSYGEKYGYPFLVTSTQPADSLAQLLQQEGPLSPERALALLKQIAAALDYAHLNGVVHGSLKASDVLLHTQQNVLLTGFSLKQMLTLSGLEESERPYSYLLDLYGSFLGAPEYMAPELVEGVAPDARSDMYALGMLMYEMLSGSLPFSGEDPLAVAFQHIEELVPPLQTRFPALTAALDLIVQRALESDPVQRYTTAGKLVAAFERVLVSVPSSGSRKNDRDGRLPAESVYSSNPKRSGGNVLNVLGVAENTEVTNVDLSQNAESVIDDLQEEDQKVMPFLGSVKLPIVRMSKESEQHRGLLSGGVSSQPISQLPQTPLVDPDLAESGGWQLRPPIITNHMAAVKVTSSPQPALEAYPPLPDMNTLNISGMPGEQQTYEPVESQLSPFGQPRLIDQETLILQPGLYRSADPDTLVLPSERAEHAGSEVLPVGMMERAKNFWQEAEPGKEFVDPYTWLSTTSAMANAQSASMSPPNAYTPTLPPQEGGVLAPLPVNKGRRKILAVLATGGVVSLGLLGLGGVSLSHFLQNQPKPIPQAVVPASKAKITPKAPVKAPPKAPAKTPPKGVVIGKQSQTVNSALHFTNPPDQQEALLIHLPNGNFVAYERACTHEQVPVNYDPKSHQLICPRHYSVFDPQAGAKVLSGPAPAPLKKVKIRINADGSISLAL